MSKSLTRRITLTAGGLKSFEDWIRDATVAEIKETCSEVAWKSVLGKLCKRSSNIIKENRVEFDEKFSGLYDFLFSEAHNSITQEVPENPCLAPNFLSEPPQNLAEGFVHKYLSKIRYLTSLLIGDNVGVPQDLYKKILKGPAYQDWLEKLSNGNETLRELKWLWHRMGTEVGAHGGFGWHDSSHITGMFEQAKEEGWEAQNPVCLSTESLFGELKRDVADVAEDASILWGLIVIAVSILSYQVYYVWNNPPAEVFDADTGEVAERPSWLTRLGGISDMVSYIRGRF